VIPVTALACDAVGWILSLDHRRARQVPDAV